MTKLDYRDTEGGMGATYSKILECWDWSSFSMGDSGGRGFRARPRPRRQERVALAG